MSNQVALDPGHSDFVDVPWFKVACDNIPAGLFAFNDKGEFLFWNKHLQRTLGYSESHCIGMKWLEISHPQDHGLILGCWAEWQRSNAGFDCEFRVMKADGSFIWMRSHVQTTSELKNWTSIGSCDDITPEKVAQLALAESRDGAVLLEVLTDRLRGGRDEDEILRIAVEGLRKLLNLLSCDAVLYDLEPKNGEIVYDCTLSDFSTRSKLTSKEVFPDIYSRIFKGELIMMCLLEQTSKKGRPSMLVCPIRGVDDLVIGALHVRKDGDYIYSSSDQHLIAQVAARIAIAIRESCLHRKTQAQALEIEAEREEKNQFIEVITHELGNPISSIKMVLTLLDAAIRDPRILGRDEKIMRYLSILSHECEREVSLITDLLDLQRLEYGAINLNPQATDVELLLIDLSKSFRDKCAEREQEMHLELDANLPILSCDTSIICRIVLELLNNAWKYTPKGHKICLAAKSIDNSLMVSVTNTGVTVDPEDIPHLFNRFYRGRSTPNPWKSEGTGLGLALTQRLCERIGGSINLFTKRAETCFVVRLPIDALPKFVE